MFTDMVIDWMMIMFTDMVIDWMMIMFTDMVIDLDDDHVHRHGY